MHVLMLLTKPFRFDPRVLKEARSLQGAGHRVTLLEWARHDPDSAPEEVFEGTRVLRLRPAGLGQKVPSTLWRTRRWWRHATQRALDLHRQDPYDVVHAHDLDTLPIAARLKRALGVPVVYDAHEIFRYMIEEDHPRLVAAAAQRLEDRLLGRVDRLITVNEAFAAFYRERTKAPVSLVLNCPDATPQPYQRPPDGPFTVSYIGVLHHSRFFPDAVHALGDLPGVRFVIAGKREGCYDEVEAASSRYKNVEFLGTIPARDVMARTLQSHAVLCLFDPTHRINRTGTPNKMYEAMVAGRPILCSRGTHSGDFVEHEGYGVAIEYGAEPLRRAVAALRDDAGACERMGRRGAELARTGYTWEHQAKALLSVYDSLTATGPSRLRHP